MAKMTLLELTQEILSNMSSDEVNSIGDSTESLQVANIIKQKYRDIISRSHLPEHKQLFQLTPSVDSTKPVLMTVPNEVKKIEWVKYFNDEEIDGVPFGYTYVTILPNEQFIDTVQGFNPSDSDVSSFVFTDTSSEFLNNFTFYYKNLAQPTYCTIISNKYIIFDTYNSVLELTLQASKTMCFGEINPVFRMEDSFIPELADQDFSLLLNEAKSLAFYELKQMPHAKAEQEIKRQWTSVQKNKSVADVPSSFDRLPDFGRRGVSNFSRRWWDGRN